MKGKTKVEIIIPFIDSQKKGDIRYMKPKDALTYEKEGLVKILSQMTKKAPSSRFVRIQYIVDTPTNKRGDVTNINKKGAKEYIKEGLAVYYSLDTQKPKKTNRNLTNSNKIINPQPKNKNSCAITQIIERHRQYEPKGFINLFRADDMKKLKDNKSEFYSTSLDIKQIKSKIDNLDESTYGVFMNINPLNKSRRRKEDVTKIIYAFIDLDDAKEEHNKLIKDNLNKFKITYSYNAKSGHGYHFLIPLELEPTQEPKIKGFLSYLKNNICDKVDLTTADNGRIMRIPKSFHKKDKVEKQLKTLHNHTPTKEEIKSNNELILEYQAEQKKGKIDLVYTKSIRREDIFFSTLVNNKVEWHKYFDVLNKHDKENDGTGSNQIFNKNLAIFSLTYPNLAMEVNNFIQMWNNQYVTVQRYKAWLNKLSKESLNKDGNKVNYFELLKWAKQYKLKPFVDLLKQQVKTSFLDKYELYYLEDEKKENNTLLYYPEKNYYLQKSLQEVLINIYYDCNDRGVDVAKDLNLDLIDDWEDFSFKKQFGIIINSIHSKIERESRIKLVYNINYEPSNEKFIEHQNKKSFNTYNKTELWDFYKKKKKHHFPKVEELILNLCGADKKSYDWFNKWLAWQIQHPTEKLPTAVILQGRQGSGKGTFKALILDAIFGSNCQEINQTHLESSFNEYLLGKQIIVANEVMHNENRQTLPNVLKNLVTDPEITISRKFRKEIVGRNFTHWIFCTNSDNPIKIDEDDRRYSVFYSEKIRQGLGKEIRQNIKKEMEEYICYLKDIKVTFEEVSEPLSTIAKDDIIELNKDSIQKFLDELPKYNSIEDLYKDIFAHTNHLEYFGQGNQFLLASKFYKVYESWCKENNERGVFNINSFGRKLKSKQIQSFSTKYKDEETNKYKSARVYDINVIEQLMEVQQ